VPDEWLTLVRGNLRTNAAFDFCSEQCLTQWMTGNIAQPQTGTSPYKTRRFIMYNTVDDEQPTLGALWADGHIELDGKSWHCDCRSSCFHCQGSFESMDMFHEYHPGYKIIWIDQERKA
jgi:hypothetical protein